MMFKYLLHYVLYLPKRLILCFIRFYQKTFSPDHGWSKVFYPGGCCKFRPTCSQYAYQAVDEHGIIRGLWLASRRLLRCHPWTPGGWDPVPPRIKR